MKFFQIVPTHTNIDFIGKFKYFIAFSIISGIATIAAVFLHGFNYGIDFSGGTVMQIKFAQPRNSEDVRKLISELGEPDASVVSLGADSREYLITVRPSGKETEETSAKATATTPAAAGTIGTAGEGNASAGEKAARRKGNSLSQKLQAKVGPNAVEIQKADEVGPKVGAELKLAALRSLVYSVILITIYIWLRFDFRFAPGATIAMIHDLILSSAFYLITGREFTITSIAALLTIAGYSVNDTIVVYDRVRELHKKGGTQLPLPETINKAVNQTLSRTLLTSGVTLISIVPIIFFCTGEIQSFAMAMCLGIFVGTYSTVYIASPFTIYVEKFIEYRKKKLANRKVAIA
jgi:preprotein translocase subunit SecF